MQKTQATDNVISLSANADEPLRVCVENALRRYFADLNGHDPGGLHTMVMREVEQPLLQIVLEHTGGNQTQAAAILGINRSTLRKKLRQHELDD